MTQSEILVRLKQEWLLFKMALMFFTRIPVGKLEAYDQDLLNQSARYFPLVGVVVGFLCALVYALVQAIWPPTVSVILSVGFGIWLTGAFHEDGLADCCDGLGGGWDKARILEIMKDSRIGTYGFVGLGLVLSLKVFSLIELAQGNLSLWAVCVVMVAGHTFSRWSACVIMRVMAYVRLDETSKSKPIAKTFSQHDSIFASIIALVVACFLPWPLQFAVLGMLPLAGYLAYKLHQWLQGYTGDGLGAIQQLSELGFYLGVLSLV